MAGPVIPGPADGLTLLELMLTLAVVAILISQAAPAFSAAQERQRLIGAVESAATTLQHARMLAITRHGRVYVTVQRSAALGWCLAVAVDVQCRCFTPAGSSCGGGSMRRTLRGDQFRGIRLDQAAAELTRFSFTPPRGFVQAGSLNWISASGLRLRIVRSGLGRIRICEPDSALGRYPSC